jgi:bifunctional non-homologous end joining protein LigD
VHKPKLDGYRFQIVKDGRQVKLYSRSGYEWTRRLALLAEALAALRCKSAVIDGELVFPTSGGRPDFRGLQGAMASDLTHHELAVFAFDLMRYEGTDLRPEPLLERRLEAAERHGLEGIVSKRTQSPYRSGPSRDWVKAKTAAWRVANRDRWKAFQRSR